MSKAIGWKNRFNSGELADEAWSNSDLQQHANGCALALNAMPRAQGPLQKSYGFWFAGLCMDQDAATIQVPFKRSVDDAWSIELGDGYGRVRDALGAPVMSGMSPLQFVSPYAAADLAGLRWYQTGDVIVFFHADGRQPQRLLRGPTGGWGFAPYLFENGPWRTENTNRALTIEADDITGVVNLTASAALFDPGMVGASFRLRAPEGSIGLQTWTPDVNPPDASLWLSNGRAYYAGASLGDEKTGLTPPIHEQGSVSDGNIVWTFLHDGSGVVQITAVTDSTHATGLVLQTLPYQGSGGGEETYNPASSYAFPATSTWAEAAYSDYRGWPTAWPTVREQRLVVGGGRSEPDKFDASRTAGYDTAKADFKPGLGTGRVVADDAVRQFCGDQSSTLAWLISAGQLIAGTHADENVIAGATLDEPLTPDGTKVRPLTEYGSQSGVAPTRAHDAVLYVARGGTTLRELVVGGDLSLAGGDLSFLAEHIAGRGIAQLAWCGEPDNLLWARLEDGGLACFLYHREQKAFGWARQALGATSADDPGWTVENISALPGAYGRTALWVHALRIKNGAPQRMILIQSARQEGLRLHAAERYAGAATTGVSGLDHLEGESVTLMTRDAQGRWAQYRDRPVTGGVATLPGGRTATEILAGLPYLFRFESLPTDLEGPGSTQGQRTRVTQMLVIAKGVAGAARAGTITDGEAPSPLDSFGVRNVDETSGVVPKRLAVNVTCSAGASRDGRLVVEDDSGFDFTLHALRPVGWSNA
ncbi:hypothetical protein [Caulobacter sp. BK020]|uniref:hypothetical protein n=1 Tax=Caulobacter sp. BK020 TaxID=2512117 RepID=UPI001044179C|nr:hypothetical protein [Caulobacter sp. BK020]TCS14544.1 hypothetical protein EV278_107193 [Caulobacter sp. BK020]